MTATINRNKEEGLIITLQLAEEPQHYFNALRRKHFPAYCNYLDAHLSLFYHLPLPVTDVMAILLPFSARPVMRLVADRVCNLGKGVAYGLASEELQELHSSLQQLFDPWLVPADRRLLWPHITIQRKVSAYKAELLCRQLTDSFAAFEVEATGFHCWHYRKGLWEPAGSIPFLQDMPKLSAEH